MKSFLILLSILLSLTKGNNFISSLISLSNYGIHYHPDIENDEASNFRGELFKILREDVESRNISNSNISKSCLNVINRLLLGHIDEKNFTNISYIISDYHIIKALDDSSKNRNNLGTYDQCMYKSYKFAHNLNKTDDRYLSKDKTYSTYIVIALDRNYSESTKILELDYDFILHGFCFPQGYIIDEENDEKGEYCTDDDYLKLINYYNEQYNNLFLLNRSRQTVFTLRQNPHESETTSTFWKIINSLPVMYFGIQTLFYLLFLIIKAIRKYRKNKKEKILDENKDSFLIEERISDVRDKPLSDDDDEDDNNIKLNEFFQCFNPLENWNELFNFSINSTKYNNDSGLNYIRGLIGISIVFVLVGFAFVAMYNAPTKVSAPGQLIKLFREDWLFNIFIIIGIRYSPRIILSCSGYLLAFKYVSYLDKNFIKNTESILISSLKFISYQIHKYFLLIMILLAERFSVYHLYTLLKSESPMFKYFNINILQKPKISTFLLSFTLIGTIIQYKEEQYRNGQHLLLYFWLPFNEIIFFLLGILIISFGFKYQWRIDIIIIILTPIIYIAKIVYSYLIENAYQGDDGQYPLKKWYASLYYVLFNYGRDMINPLFNLPYYLIGMYFGLVNYTIQKGINSIYKESKAKTSPNEEIEGLLTKKDEESVDDISEDNLTNDNSEDNIKKSQLFCEEIEKMHFLLIPVKFVLWNRKKATFKNRIVILVIIIISAILISFLISFYIIDIFYDDYNETFKDPVFNVIYRIDIELFVFFMHWFLLIIMINSKNFLLDFFNHIIWIIISRPYFSFILIANTLLLFLFYHEETLIEINAITILMYSLIGGGFTFFFTSFFYIFFELPLKRMIRLFYKWYSDSKEQKENEKDKMKQKNDDDSENDEENSDDNFDKVKNE